MPKRKYHRDYRHKWAKVKGEHRMFRCTKCGVVVNENERKRGGRSCQLK